jgi:thiamine biosynthesis lipoprotein ApbE
LYQTPISLVNGGGNIAAGEAPPGTKSWKIALPLPGSSDTTQASMLVLHYTSISTFGLTQSADSLYAFEEIKALLLTVNTTISRLIQNGK